MKPRSDSRKLGGSRPVHNLVTNPVRGKFVKFAVSAEMLNNLEFFQELAVAKREEVAKRCEGRRYAAATEIVRHTETSRDVYFLLSGRAQVTVYSSSGRVITFDEVGPGAMFGELAAIDQQPRVASVTAVDTSQAIRLPADSFMQLVTSEPDLARYALRRLTHLIRQHCERIFEFHALPVPARIRAEFLRVAQAQARGEDRVVLAPKPTDQDIANRVGTNREQVNRERRALIRQGILKEDGTALIICSLSGLKREIE